MIESATPCCSVHRSSPAVRCPVGATPRRGRFSSGGSGCGGSSARAWREAALRMEVHVGQAQVPHTPDRGALAVVRLQTALISACGGGLTMALRTPLPTWGPRVAIYKRPRRVLVRREALRQYIGLVELETAGRRPVLTWANLPLWPCCWSNRKYRALRYVVRTLAGPFSTPPSHGFTPPPHLTCKTGCGGPAFTLCPNWQYPNPLKAAVFLLTVDQRTVLPLVHLVITEGDGP